MQTRDVIIGCDPGLDGAFAVLIDGQLVELEDMPTMSRQVAGSERRYVSGDTLDGLLRSLQSSYLGPADTLLFVLEEVSGATVGGRRKGAAGAFSFGKSFGMVEQQAIALNWPRLLVRPEVWPRGLKLRKGKDVRRQRAMELWPRMKAEFARVKDDGRADAALIAYWAHVERRNS